MQKAMKAAREAFLEIERLNQAAVRKTGEIDRAGIARALEAVLSNPRLRDVFILLLAEFIGTALDGSIIDISNWKPMR